MNPRPCIAALVLLTAAGAGLAQDDRYTTTIKLVQEKLHIHGFYSGPIDGNPEGATQAALAQFQRSRLLPADGAPDKRTLDELGVVLEEPASAGASAAPAEGARPAAQGAPPGTPDKPEQ